jgi:hypothetical protein
MHESNAGAFASDPVPVTVRAHYDQFAVYPFAHREICEIPHRPTIYTKTRVLQGTVVASQRNVVLQFEEPGRIIEGLQRSSKLGCMIDGSTPTSRAPPG